MLGMLSMLSMLSMVTLTFHDMSQIFSDTLQYDPWESIGICGTLPPLHPFFHSGSQELPWECCQLHDLRLMQAEAGS